MGGSVVVNHRCVRETQRSCREVDSLSLSLAQLSVSHEPVQERALLF